MKVPVHYLNDKEGNLQAVQIAADDWYELVDTLRRYEERLKMKTALAEALGQVKRMRAGKLKKRSLASFLREL